MSISTLSLRRRLAAVPVCCFFLLATFLLATACGPSSQDAPAAGSDDESPDDAPLVVYSGRNKSLVGPLLERFESARGKAVEVRYGETAELAATLLEEGEGSPCDVFLAQDAAALGVVEREGRFQKLPADVLERVPAHFSSADGRWIGLSGRARVVVYNPELVSVDELPTTLDQVTDPRYRGRFGIAPANASFQAHLALYRALRGDDALRKLLQDLTANEPQRYAKNSAIVEATLRGEIEWGLVNHYYLWRAKTEDPQAPGENFVMTGDRASSFLNLAGVGVISERPAAIELARYLVSDEAQRYFADETFEYPLVEGIAARHELAPLDSFPDSRIDFAALSDSLAPTLDEIVSIGLLE